MNDLFPAQNSGTSNNLKQSKSQPELKALVGWILLNIPDANPPVSGSSAIAVPSPELMSSLALKCCRQKPAHVWGKMYQQRRASSDPALVMGADGSAAVAELLPLPGAAAPPAPGSVTCPGVRYLAVCASPSPWLPAAY